MATEAVAGTLQASIRAWWHLVWLSCRRQFWTLQTLIAVLLIVLLAAFVAAQSVRGYARWGIIGWSFLGFTDFVVTGIYLSFLLPILCLCFGTQALGGDWEERSLVWLLTRPLPRPLIYSAKFLAAVPWTFGLTLGGLLLLGVAGGPNGVAAVWEFWPAVALGTLAYLSLFVLIGAWFRRSTIIAVAYSFVLEAVVGNLPGMVKRASIAFYARCMVFASDIPGVKPDESSMFMEVSGPTAVRVLVGVAAALFVIGMFVFARREYNDLT
jgi:ABC-type transport system involved in multi-copper enzyme maturation permease subunit